MFDFLLAAYDRIPTLVGMKYTHTDLLDFSNCSRFFSPSFNMIMGYEELMLPAAALGCDAYVGSTFNVDSVVPHYLEILAAVKNNNLQQVRSYSFPYYAHAILTQDNQYNYTTDLFRL